MNEIIIAAGFGIVGAFVRVLIVSLKQRKLNYSGLYLYALVVISVGAFSGILLSYGKILSFLAGYAGVDLIEGYYKVFMKKLSK